ncbi:uncharacterized protein At4g28440-like [Malania oleifera]|uniref:uncharacterized protein At4g28440-like n=1 Tax=Malania oleifera TaxID=397392 RepID=UPI0025ADC8B9|nr:uncharacterized protein At4g28440-like [Malania oleifera]
MAKIIILFEFYYKLKNPNFKPKFRLRVWHQNTHTRLETEKYMATTTATTTRTATAKRKPVFVKVDQLKPGTSGHTLAVKVVNSKTVLQKGRSASQLPNRSRIAECLVGDETASILFTARNEQVDMMKPGATLILRNAKIDMFKGSMRLAVDKWGRVEVTEPAKFVVKEDNNLSLVEYELVNVAEE